jgi:DNA gyrase subunit A
VIELKRDSVPEVVLNQLFKFTQLQTSFAVNMLALNGGRPMMMALKDMIVAFIAFREEVITKRTIFELSKARERAHILVGLAISVVNLDPVITLIRNAPDPQTAKEKLIEGKWRADDVAPLIKLMDEPGHDVIDGYYQLSDIQAKAILELRLQRLTGLERDKIHSELTEIGEQIREYLDILASREKLYLILRNELLDIKNQFDTPRRTMIDDTEFESDIEDLIVREDMVVTVTNTGYVKRVALTEYKSQRRGGKGRSGMGMRDEDFVTQLFVANTHTPIIFFSSTGIAYKMKVYRLPLGSLQSKGKAMINLLPLREGETISTVMPLPEDETTWSESDVMFATASGNVRRNKLSDFTDIRANGKIAMKLDPGDKLIAVQVCNEQQDILLAAKGGKSIRFHVGDVRVFASRASDGVRGIRLEPGNEVISMSVLRHVDFDSETRDSYLRGDLPESERERLASLEEHILSVSENGFGKRTSAYEYRITNRGGSGIANIEMTEKTGPVVASFPVSQDDQLMMVTDGGKMIRISVGEIRIAGRKTQGVTLLKTAINERVVSVARLMDIASDDEGDDLSEDHEINGLDSEESTEGE